MTVNILGTTYQIKTHKFSEDNVMKQNNWSGYCDSVLKLIVVADFSESEYFDYKTAKERKIVYKQTLRHEITHAFLDESGLRHSSLGTNSWAVNEEMVDWFANQAPKIYRAFKEVGAM